MKKISFLDIEKLKYGRNESMNSLMTNIQYSGEDIKSVLITSCNPSEGKTTVAFNLAQAFAENGYSTIFIDMDFRKSAFIERYKLRYDDKNIQGLVQLLSGRCQLSDVFCNTNIKNLDVALGGNSTNPPGLLKSSILSTLMEALRNKYDVIIIDSPPVGTVIDAAILAPMIDGVALVAEYNSTTEKQALDAKKQLEASGANVLGVILNKTPLPKEKEYYYKKHH